MEPTIVTVKTPDETVLPSFMYVSRRRSLGGGDVLVDLLVQGQGHQSVSDGQPQRQRLLGGGGAFTASSAHVLLGIIEALDRLPERRRHHKKPSANSAPSHLTALTKYLMVITALPPVGGLNVGEAEGQDQEGGIK